MQDTKNKTLAVQIKDRHDEIVYASLYHEKHAWTEAMNELIRLYNDLWDEDYKRSFSISKVS